MNNTLKSIMAVLALFMCSFLLQAQEQSVLTVCYGDEVTLSVDELVNEGDNPTFQWYLNGEPIDGADEDTFTYEPENGDIICCDLTSDVNCADPKTVRSNCITITVISVTEVAITSPSDICAGETYTFEPGPATVENCSEEITYQWQELIEGTWTDISGEDEEDFTTPKLDAGDYYYRRVATCGDCSDTTATVKITATEKVMPKITIKAE